MNYIKYKYHKARKRKKFFENRIKMCFDIDFKKYFHFFSILKILKVIPKITLSNEQ